MRLTLRTLLAWLDGVLAKAEQEELATKVAASPVAPRLVERIHDVMARAGLTAPRPDGRGLADDPNSVAEFLDNVLPPDRLEAFERVCIESDMHLAEAADCHAILAEMARDPAAVLPLDRRLRKRLIEQLARSTLQPVMPANQALVQSHIAEAAAPAATAFEPPLVTNGTTARAGRPPATGPKASWAAWLSAAVAVLLLLGLVGLLTRSLWPQSSEVRQVAAARKDPTVAPAAAPPPAVAEPPPADPAPPVAASDPNAAAPDAAAAPNAEPAAGAEVMDRELRVVPEPPRPNPPPTVPLPEMQVAEPEPAVAAPQPQSEPHAVAVPPGAVAEGGGLLHRVGEADAARWQPLAPGDRLGGVEEFAVPAHSFPRVIRGDIAIRFHPGTLAALVTDADGTPRLEVVFGRAVAWTEAAEAPLGVAAGGLSGVVTIGKGQPLGVAVDLVRESGTDPAVVSPGRTALVHASGGARWRQTELDGGPPGQPLAGLGIEQALPPRSNLEWTSADPATARITPVGRSPAWMQQESAATRPDQSAGAELARRLAAAPGDDAVDVAATLRQMATDRRAENRMAAAATAALLGDYRPAVSLLCAESPELVLRDGQWSGFEAATVQHALGRGANAAARLRETFAEQDPGGRGEQLYRLACGLTPEELAGGAAVALVESLADAALVVRRYAFRTLNAAFPDDPAGRVEYAPDRPAGLNDKGIQWWRRKVAEATAVPAP